MTREEWNRRVPFLAVAGAALVGAPFLWWIFADAADSGGRPVDPERIEASRYAVTIGEPHGDGVLFVPVAVLNRGGPVQAIWAECSAWRGDTLVATATKSWGPVAAGEKVTGQVFFRPNPGRVRTECRVTDYP